MATTIDQKVVEIKFDNRDFEKNTKQTMSTLDRLKEKLNFKGASDGLEKMGKAADKVNMNGLADGIETVSLKISALDIVAFETFRKITDYAIDAGAKMIKSMSVDQISSGWNKMTQKVSSVQTLVNSTGLSVDEIDEYLSQLMWYSDETSYSFTDMTTALANMTATGGDIKNLVPMIRGMANATAFAGKGAAEFSRVIYNLNQSYGAGALTLMDWRSVQNATVNSKQLVEELIRAGVELGEIEEGEVTLGNFNDSLKDRWATSEVMERAFARFDELSSAAYELSKKEGITTAEAIERLSSEYDDLAVAAFRSAQEAKTFQEAMDATADASSSAWMEIFSSIFGNYEEQKKIFTNFANWLYGVFVDPIYEVQAVIDEAFNVKQINKIFDKISNNPIKNAIDEVDKKLTNSSHTLEEYQKLVWRIWEGDFNNAPYRQALIEAEGYNYQVAQSLVNLTAKRGDGGGSQGQKQAYKLTIEDVIEYEEKYGIVSNETTEEIEKEVETLDDLTDKELEHLGLTQAEIDIYNRLKQGAEKYGWSLDELIEKMTTYDARSLLFGKKAYDENGKMVKVLNEETGELEDVYEVMGVAQNIAGFFSNIFGKIKEAWDNTFSEIIGVDLYMFILRLNEASARLLEITKNADSQGMKNLHDTFTGIFSLLKLITTIMGGGFRIALTVVKTILQTLGYDLLDLTGAIGRVITKFTDFLTNNSYITKTIVFLTKAISKAIISIHDYITNFITLNKVVEKVGNALKYLKSSLAKIGKTGLSTLIKDLQKFFEGLKNADNIPKYIFESIVKGIKKFGKSIIDYIEKLKDKIYSKFSNVDKGGNFFEFGVNCVKGLVEGIKSKSKDGIKAFAEWASNILKKFAEKLGIHSPSKKFFDFGGNIVQGLYNGISSTVSIVYNLLKDIVEKIIGFVKDADIGTIFVGLISAGAIYGLIKLAGAFNILADGLNNFNQIGETANKLLKTFNGVLKSLKVKIITSALKDVAISIAVLAGSIAVLSLIDPGKMWSSVGAIVVLTALLGGLVAVVGKFGKKEALNFGKIALAVLAVGVAVSLIAKAFKKIASIENISLMAIIAFGLVIGGLIGVSILISKSGNKLEKMSTSLLAIGATFMLMSMAVKKLGKLNSEELKKGILTIALFELLIVGLMAATRLLGNSGNVANIGGALLAVSACFILMGSAVKKLGKMDSKQLEQGMKALNAFEVLIIGLMAATRLLGNSGNVANIGKSILSVAAVILVMGIVTKMLGNMDSEKIFKGIASVGSFIALILGLVYGLKRIGPNDIANIRKTLTSVSVCLAVMVLSTALLGMMDLAHLSKGIIAVGLLTLFIICLVKSTENARNLGKSLWAFVGAIGVLALAVGLLSLIDPARLAVATVALGSLMLCFGLMIKLAKDVGGNKSTLIGLGVMVGIVAILGGIITGLSFLDPGNVINAAGSIAILLITLVSSLWIVSKINTKDILFGLIGLLSIVVLLYPIVDVITKLSNVSNVMEIAKSLSLLLASMTLMLTAIGVIGIVYSATGGMAMLGLVGMLAMIPLLYSIVGVIALMSKIDSAEKNTILLSGLLNTMVKLLVPLALLGPLAVVGVAALYALTALIPILLIFVTGIGALMQYVPALQTFITSGIKVLVQLASGLGEMIGAFVNSMLTALSSGLPEIGSNLSKFMINATPFIAGCNLVTEQTAKGVGILTKAILGLTGTKFLNGIMTFLSGGDNFSTLGTELSKFAIAASPFIAIASSIPKGAMDGISSLSDAILSLTAGNLMNSINEFLGKENTLSKFASEFPIIGTYLGQFATNIGTFTDKQVDTVNCAGQAIKAMADAANELPKQDGIFAKIFGDNSLSSFAENMPGVASGVRGFITNLGTFDDKSIKTAECGCKVIESVSKVADALPKNEGVWQKLFGNNSLSTFADDMPNVATKLKEFVNNLADCNPKEGIMDVMSKLMNDLVNMGNVKYNGSLIKNIKKTLTNVGDGVSSFVNKLKDVSKDDVEASEGKLNVISSAVNNFVNAVNTSFTNKKDSIVSTVEGLAKDTASGFASENVLKEVKTKSGNFVDGFANGIKNGTSKVTGAAKEMAGKALDAISKRLDEHSPSKETIKQGEYFGEGFVIGVGSYASKVYDVSSGIANEAKQGLAKSIAKISNLVESEMDTQPVIRPVLDLSDVTNNVGYINSLIGSPSMGVMANLSSISSGMNNRNQNGNSDVVSAIDKLGKNIGNTTGNTYNINGISYDSDSNVANAIETLVHAITVERRI